MSGCDRIKKAASLAQAGEGGHQVVPLEAVREIALPEGLTVREFEAELLQNNLVPLRYLRNIGTLGMDGQAKLLLSSAAVVGCGGLGGWIIELLARLGVGRLTLIDGDVFSESNLNRQALCTEANLGRNKAEAAAARVREINGAVEAIPYPVMMTKANAETLLEKNEKSEKKSIVFDALDNLPSRLLLLETSQALGIPMIHGAIAGWWGQVADVGDGALASLWRNKGEKGVETIVGTPGFTPSYTASMQVALGVRMLIGKKTPTGLLWLDLEGPALEKISL